MEVDLEGLRRDVLCEFLEVSWHLILYMRKLYPAALFGRRRKYGVGVFMCRHPELTEYLKHILKTVRELLERRELEKVILVVESTQNGPQEQFVFQLGAFNGDDILSRDNYLIELESTLRAFLLRLAACDDTLKSLPADCTFSIVLETQQSAATRMEALSSCKQDDLHWIPAESSNIVKPGSLIHPLKSAPEGLLNMQLYVQVP